MANRKRWRKLTGLGLGITLIGVFAYWRFSDVLPGPMPDARLATEEFAPATIPPDVEPSSSRSSGKLTATQTPWRLEEPRSDARGSPADLRRRPAIGPVPCEKAIGKWRMSPGVEIVLAPFGEVGRVSGNEIVPEPGSSWICTRAGGVDLQLPEGRFVGSVNDTGEFALTTAAGARLERQPDAGAGRL